jgi:hypothetical protein
MATQRDVSIFFKVDGIEEYITSLEQLDDVLKKVKGATDEATQSTDKLEQATDGINSEEFERKLQTMEGAVKVLAGSFEFLAGAASLLGVEDNAFFKELEENVIGVLALSRGAIDAAEGIRLLAQNQRLAAAAQAVFNAVANANPYVLLTSAIIAAAGALLIFKNNEEETGDVVVDVNDKLQKQINSFDKYNASIDRRIDAQRRLLLAQNGELTLEQELDFIRQKKEERTNDIIRLEEELRDIIKFGVNEDEKERYALVNQTLDARREEIRVFELDIEVAKAEDARKRKEAKEAANEKRNAEAAAKKAEEATKKAADEAAAALVKETAILLNLKQLQEARTNILDEQGELEEELYRAGLDERELAFRDLEDDYYRRINLANGNAELLLQIEEQYRKDKDELTSNFNNVDLQRQMDFNQMVLEAEQGLQDAKFGIARAGVELFTALAGENEKAANIAFAIEKALAVGEVVVNLQRELAANRANPSWKLLPDGGLTLIAAANTKARINAGISIASILATTIAKFKSGGSPNINNNTDTTSPGGALGVPQPEVRFGGNQTIGTPEGIQSVPVRAYVLVSDVNNAQQANNQIERYSRL